MRITFLNIVSFLILLTFSTGCVEGIGFSTETEFDSLLVIEATITNENKQQEIKLSRVYRLESDGLSPENGADISLVGSDGSHYVFQTGVVTGTYRSISSFAAQSNVDYHLEITTSDGKQYSSEIQQLTPVVRIDDLYVERNFNENEEEGVSIFVDATASNEESIYYRYEYEETYKVVAPLYSPLELVILNDDFDYPPEIFIGNTLQEIKDFFFLVQQRPEQEQICYNTVKSNNIILGNTNNLTDNDIDQFRVRFIGRQNYIMSHRYSILVRQYIQSQEANTYYRTLSEFANSERIFSENQIGFLEGNVFSISNEEENVVGFFEVSSVDAQRVYFNYADLFPGDQLPPYVIECDDFISPILLKEDFVHNIIGSPVMDALNQGFQYYDVTNDTDLSPFAVMPYLLVQEPCGDCTVLGENVVPDFWED